VSIKPAAAQSAPSACASSKRKYVTKVLLIVDFNTESEGAVSATSGSSGGFCIWLYRNWLMIENSAMGSGQIDDEQRRKSALSSILLQNSR
jgi:hypothetical protein